MDEAAAWLARLSAESEPLCIALPELREEAATVVQGWAELHHRCIVASRAAWNDNAPRREAQEALRAMSTVRAWWRGRDHSDFLC